MRPVIIIESPYRGNATYDEMQNSHFLAWIQKEWAFRGFNPIASHGYYPHFLNEYNPLEREMGMRMGLELGLSLNPSMVVFNVREHEDLSEGMSLGLDYWKEKEVHCQLHVWKSLGGHSYRRVHSRPL